MTEPQLSVNLDAFRYPDGTVALADIRLGVKQGEFCGILGSNGSGKTTRKLPPSAAATFRAIARLRVSFTATTASTMRNEIS